MRPIKFRAWDEEAEYMYYSDKCWENDEATFVCENDGTLKCYVPETIEATRDEPEHIVGREISPIMQFTGRKDKNKKEVYDKDILKTPGNQRILVEIDNLIDGDGKFRSILIEECEIIGTEILEKDNGGK